jgi:hypothetical protein
LITRASGENVGPTNYTSKLDFRRVLDGEVRRGGTVVFAPDPDEDFDLQTRITNTPITLIHGARKPNGKTAVIVGSATKLWRYFSFEDGNVYVAAPAGQQVFDVGVYEDVSGVWLVIGEGFSTSGHRWEAVDVGGKTVFNNGVDLPVIYDLDWLKVQPLRELREQGIACVETIENYNGYLVVGNIKELTAAGLTETMNGRSSGILTISQAGNTATASSAFFTSTDVGKTLFWPTIAPFGGKITGYTSSTSVTLDTYNNVPATNYAQVATQYGTITTEAADRTQYRMLWSGYDDPENFGSASPVAGSVGSYTVNLPRSMASLKVGDSVVVTGGGASGGDLLTTVTLLDPPNYTVVTLADPLLTAVTVDENVIYKATAVGSAAGSADLQDTNSAILRLVELQGRLIVLKEDAIFLGQTTGVAASPFSFQKLYTGPKSLFYRWSVAKIDNTYLMFGGRYAFYSFDPSNVAPREHPKLELCKNLFNQTLTPDANVAYVSPLTQEVIFFDVGGAPSNRVCYDYVYETVSTSSLAVTAGGAVYVPDNTQMTTTRGIMTLVGTGNGYLLESSDSVYTRVDTSGSPTLTGLPYDSVLRGGLVSFGDEFNEKDLRSYVLYFGEVSPPTVEVKFYGTRNAHEAPAVLFTRSITSPGYKNLINCFFRKNYFQDQLTISGANTGAKIVRRLFEASSTDGRSTIRTP